MAEGLRVIFMGTPDFAVPALQAILDAGHDVIAVYTQPPRPKGRGNILTKSPVHELAERHNIPVYSPQSLRKSVGAQNEFAALKADIAVVAAYGLILPQTVLDAPKYGCLNIHGSILPRWRGASPIQHAVWHGDAETGVTIMQMDAGLDTGPMIDISRVPVTATTTSASLYHDLGQLGAQAIIRVLGTLVREKKVCTTPQPGVGVTLAPLLKKEDGRIDWNKSAREIDCQIRALNPWPGAYCQLPNGEIIKILSARVQDYQGHGQPGTILDKKLGLIACGDGTCLHVTQIQAPSGKKMDLAAFINGGALKVGDVLS